MEIKDIIGKEFLQEHHVTGLYNRTEYHRMRIAGLDERGMVKIERVGEEWESNLYYTQAIVKSYVNRGVWKLFPRSIKHVIKSVYKRISCFITIVIINMTSILNNMTWV